MSSEGCNNVLVAGDLLPLNRDLPAFQRGDVDSLFGDLVPILKGHDLTVVNLEGPLTDQEYPILKSGPNLHAPTACVSALRLFHVAGLANNHINDHGPAALLDTKNLLIAQGVLPVGAGADLAEASQPLVVRCGTTRLGIVAMTSREFSTAGPGTPGALPADPLLFLDIVREHACTWDHLLVLLHRGHQGYPYPSPELQRLCRFFVQEGASAVICQQSHCLGCEERHGRGYILYGQGDFLFDYDKSSRIGTPGAVVSLSFGGNGTVHAGLLPLRHRRNGPGIELLRGEEKDTCLAGFYARSQEVRDTALVGKRWHDLVQSKSASLMRNMLLPPGRIWSALDRRIGILNHGIGGKHGRLLLHYFRCEELRELAEHVLVARGLEDERR